RRLSEPGALAVEHPGSHVGPRRDRFPAKQVLLEDLEVNVSDLVLAGGTVVTAEASFRADVAIAGDKIEAVGVDLPRDGAEVVDVSGARVMPGFIDGHTHMDMPFGGTVTADDWDTGTAALLAGGTTMNVDFSLQDVNGTLKEAVETWHG